MSQHLRDLGIVFERDDWRRGGINFTAEEAEELHRTGMLWRCRTTGNIFNIMRVEVLDRYTDCTGFRCPHCKQRHDDRPAGWGGCVEVE